MICLTHIQNKTVNSAVAAHLRGMRPTLTARKATQCLEETQTLTELSIKTPLCILTIVQTNGYVYIRILNNAHKYGYVFIRNQTDPHGDLTSTEQTSIHRVLLIE